MGSTGWDTEGKAGPTEDGYVGEVQAGGTVLGQGAACDRCYPHRGKVGRKARPCREGGAEKDGKTSEKRQKAWARKGLAMALMWGWQTAFILKSCPALTSPLSSFPQPWHWAQPGQDEGLPPRVGVPSVPPRCSWARHCPGPAWPPCPIRCPPALAAPIYSIGMS